MNGFLEDEKDSLCEGNGLSGACGLVTGDRVCRCEGEIAGVFVALILYCLREGVVIDSECDRVFSNFFGLHEDCEAFVFGAPVVFAYNTDTHE